MEAEKWHLPYRQHATQSASGNQQLAADNEHPHTNCCGNMLYPAHLQVANEVLILDALDDLFCSLLAEAHLVPDLRQVVGLLLVHDAATQGLRNPEKYLWRLLLGVPTLA